MRVFMYVYYLYVWILIKERVFTNGVTNFVQINFYGTACVVLYCIVLDDGQGTKQKCVFFESGRRTTGGYVAELCFIKLLFYWISSTVIFVVNNLFELLNKFFLKKEWKSPSLSACVLLSTGL